MAKPRIQARVDTHVKSEIDDFAEEHNMNDAEAIRHLLGSGLRVEEGAATDGGQVVDRVDELRAHHDRRERRELKHNALLGITLMLTLLVVSGVADGMFTLLLAGSAAVALVISSVVWYNNSSGGSK